VSETIRCFEFQHSTSFLCLYSGAQLSWEEADDARFSVSENSELEASFSSPVFVLILHHFASEPSRKSIL
jgi:hypothetical protein